MSSVLNTEKIIQENLYEMKRFIIIFKTIIFFKNILGPFDSHAYVNTMDT